MIFLNTYIYRLNKKGAAPCDNSITTNTARKTLKFISFIKNILN